MNQGQRGRNNSSKKQSQEDDHSSDYFKIIKDFRSSHSPSVVSNSREKSGKEGKGSSDICSQSSEFIKFKTPSKSKRIRHRFSLHSRKKRQISTRFRQENEELLKKKLQIWSELWRIELNYLQQNNQDVLLNQIAPLKQKNKKKQDKSNLLFRRQLLCDSQPIFLPQPQRIEMEQRRLDQDNFKNLDEDKKHQDIFIYQHPFYDNENSLFANDENNSFFFDRVEDL